MSTMARWLTSQPVSPPPLPIREPLIDDHHPLVRIQHSRPVAVDLLVSPKLEVDTDTASIKTLTVAQFAHVLAGGEGDPHVFHDESPAASAPRNPQLSTYGARETPVKTAGLQGQSSYWTLLGLERIWRRSPWGLYDRCPLSEYCCNGTWGDCKCWEGRRTGGTSVAFGGLVADCFVAGGAQSSLTARVAPQTAWTSYTCELAILSRDREGRKNTTGGGPSRARLGLAHKINGPRLHQPPVPAGNRQSAHWSTHP
ncbi:hypothetical protein JB92DRAFT_2829718 [Gautieria morchelliformis]|nr:hypothetical protein JB92DRAFT_2829718 [Gautieria morchelliformis]